MQERKLYVGYAKAVITPPIGMFIPGYGFMPRPSEGIIDDLYAYAVAFSDGENKAILFNVDALGITSAGGQRIRETISERFDVPFENIYIAATHCHTAMWVGGDLDDPEYPIYYGHQESVLGDLAKFALEDLKPATMKIAQGESPDTAFLRRYKMEDGSLVTNPKYMQPGLVCADGVQDDSVQIIRMEREGGKEVMLVNFGTHPDCIGGRLYAPDWPGYVVKTLEGALEDVQVVVISGFGGDSAMANRLAPKPTIPMLERSKRLAHKVSGAVLRIYHDVKEIPAGPVKGFEEIAAFGKNPHEPWEEPIAQQIVATDARIETELPEELQKYGMSIKKARRIVHNMAHEGGFEVPMYALQVGNVCFVGAPGEPFSETGMNIKKDSKMDMTMCSCRTNGSEGYFPTPNAYAGGGYERDYTAFGPDCSISITEAALRMIDKMEKTEPQE